MTMKTNPVPYSPDELYAQASKMAADWNIPRKWREDAVQEFVIAAAEATASAIKSVRTHQHRCGKNAMMMFLRREERAEGRTPSGCCPDAKRIALDASCPDGESEPTTVAETIVDHSVPAPDAGLIADDLEKAVAKAMTRLTPEEAEVVQRMYVEHETQTAAADAMGLTRDQIRGRIASALPILRIWLTGYRDLAGI